MGVGFSEFDTFGFGGFDTMFCIVFVIVNIGFVVILVSIVITMLRRITIWDENNHTPQLTLPAQVVSKRADISYYKHTNTGDTTATHGYHMTSNTYHYVTFEFDNGDRKEFFVKGSEYGLLKEGDKGNLCFQGTRYLSFERDR